MASVDGHFHVEGSPTFSIRKMTGSLGGLKGFIGDGEGKEEDQGAFGAVSNSVNSLWRINRDAYQTIKKTRRVTRSPTIRVFMVIILMVAAFKIYYEINIMSWYWFTNTSKSGKFSCQVSKEEMDDLWILARSLNRWFAHMGVAFWLNYGTLVGALRYNQPLPWDTDIDVGALGKDLDRYSYDEIASSLMEFGIVLEKYDYIRGFYRVRKNGARGDIFLYYESYTEGTYLHRTGIESYIFFVNYRHFHMFPAVLVELPLEAIPFCGVNMTVPHGGVELMKYQYPTSWFTEVKPVGCEEYDYSHYSYSETYKSLKESLSVFAKTNET
eukprot:Nk52_evm1s1989 gene=Nk52_evmTU1s1989